MHRSDYMTQVQNPKLSRRFFYSWTKSHRQNEIHENKCRLWQAWILSNGQHFQKRGLQK